MVNGRVGTGRAAVVRAVARAADSAFSRKNIIIQNVIQCNKAGSSSNRVKDGTGVFSVANALTM